MAKTTVRCPKCGTAFEIPETESVSVGVTIAKNSGIGDVYLKPDEDEPKKPLRDSKGHFVSNSLHGVNLAGEEYGKCNKSSSKCNRGDDSIADAVRNGGYVKNHRLFRRWIMAQFFHILRELEVGGYGVGRDSFAGIVRRRGVRYMWDVIEHEVHDMGVIRRNGDVEEFHRRFMWWNPGKVHQIAKDYLDEVTREIWRLKTRKCRGREYRAIPGWGNVFEDEIEKKVIAPFAKAVDDIDGYGESDFAAFESYLRRLVGIAGRFKESSRWNISMPTKFIDSFKGNGAYFTLRNRIMFHGCTLPRHIREGHEDLRGFRRDLACLDDLVRKLGETDGWQLVGLVKDTIKENGISVEKKIASWSK